MPLWPFKSKAHPGVGPELALHFGLLEFAQQPSSTPVSLIRHLLRQLNQLADINLTAFHASEHCSWTERDPFDDEDPLPHGYSLSLLELCRVCQTENRVRLSTAKALERKPELAELFQQRKLKRVWVHKLDKGAPYPGWLMLGDSSSHELDLGNVLAGACRELASSLSVSELVVKWREERRVSLEAHDQLNAMRAERVRDGKRRDRELERQDLKIEEAERIKNEFLSVVSHELRTPLNAIQGYTRMVLRDENLGDRQRLSLERVLSSSNNQLKLINNILEYSRLEAGRMPLELEFVELRPMLEESLSQLESLAQERKLNLKLEIAEDLPGHTVTDHPKLERVLINLLGNAIKFTHEGTVTLAAETAGGLLRFLVKDTGIGIESEEQKRIFERFHRARQSESDSRSYTGTGLGLAISRRITELLGGRVSVSSVLGEGSVFAVELPHLIDLDTAREVLSMEGSN